MADRVIESLKEQIRFETEVLGEPSPFRLVLAAFGFLGTLALGIVSWRFYKRIEILIFRLKEDVT